jgi:phosphoglycerate transport regulatory protein PgtC
MTEFFSLGRRRFVSACAAASILACLPGRQVRAAGGDDRVVVLTSYPEELTVRYQAVFERLYPGRRLEILWRQSADALAYLKRGGAADVDVYWSPAPGNFAALREAGLFARLDLDRTQLPDAIGGFPIGDPDGHYVAFELAGNGIAYNVDAVQRLGLPAPRDWADLTDPGYRGQVQLPIPGRVGFAPVLIESVLQGYGWSRGWAVLAGIAANTEFNSGDANPGSDDVVSGRKAARMTIDFFARSAIRNGAPVRFVYPPRTAFNPAQIGIFAAAPHPQAAREFVAFALSRQGQEMLLHPDVSRLPVRRDIYLEHPEYSAQPFVAGQLAYDGRLTRDRQGLVAALFESALVERHADLLALWDRLRAAERAGQGQLAPVQRARQLLERVPVDEAAQGDAALRRLFAFAERKPGEVEAPPSAQRLAVEARWRDDLATRIAEVSAALAEV